MFRGLSALFAVIFLTACGGGGGGGSAPAPAPAPAPTPAASVSLSADPLSVLLGNQTTLTWSTANASSCAASGAWSGSKATSGSEDFTIDTTGDNQFILTCSGSGGSGSDSVTVEGYEETTGVSVDGYLVGATIFYDENENFILDESEVSSITNESGGFNLRKNDAPLISLGGEDFDTQKNFEDLLLINKSSGDLDFKSITPITSVAAFLDNPQDIYSILNVDQDIDLNSYDPVANKNNNHGSAIIYERGNQLTVLAYSIQSVVNSQLSTTDTTQDFFLYIAQALTEEFSQTNEPVNIEDEGLILNIINKSLQEKSLELAEDVKENMAKILSSVVTLIQVRDLESADIALFNFATSTLITDLQSIADGSASEDLVNNYEVDKVTEYVASNEDVPEEDLTPTITAADDYSNIDEDTTTTINVLLNDSLVANVPVEVQVEGSDDGFVSLDGATVTFVPSQDFNGTTIFGYTIFQDVYDGLTSNAQVIVEVNPINDAPQITTPSALEVNENEKFVVTLEADDADGDEIAFTKRGGDANEFNLDESSGDLEFIEAPDYEESDAFNLITIASDGTDSSEKNISISIIDLDDTAPVINPPLEFIAEENQLTIGQITATDVDTDDAEITYSISGSELLISSDTGVLTFQEEPDFETKNEYNASVTATDGVNSSSEEVLVQIENLNDNAPTFISGANFAVDENQTLIGSVEAEDADGDNLSFSIDSSEISINSESGALAFTVESDYETKANYVATVTVDDGAFSATQDIAVDIININDNAPLFGSASSFTVDENQTAIGTASATDADGDALTYSISGSEISIDPNTGVMSFVAAPDYENKNSYSATITASDGENTAPQDITVTITNLNDNTPLFDSASSFTVDENQTAIGTASATDADGDALTYSISGSEISIDPNTGVMSFVAAPDFETKSNYAATVSVTDGIFETSEQIAIEIINLNDNVPVITSVSSFTVDENQTAIGTASATDADGDALTYSISGSEISIDPNTGVMSFVAAPDFETKPDYQATLTVSDGSFTSSAALSVTINDLNDNAPEFTTSLTFSTPEEETSIGIVQATDADANTQITYSTDSDIIAVGNTSGELNFLIQTDYESATQYVFNISASDGDNITTEAITVNIENINDNAPKISSLPTFRADENQTAIGQVEASDADGDTLSYSISSSDITIDSATGTLAFLAPPDYETQSSYSATVSVSDGLFSTSQQIAITIGNLEDNPPVYTGANDFFVDENQSNIGTVGATDADGSDLTFTISGSEISITGSSQPEENGNWPALLDFVSAPDYEQQTQYAATIQISDGTLTTSAPINIFINNLNDNTPSITSGTTYSADENQTAIGTVTATDADGDTVTFSISGSEINIDGNTGVLTFASAPDYETKSSYAATVTASDGENSRALDLVISVNDVNDNAPVFTSNSSFNIDENQTAIGTVTATDVDSNSITFSISGSEINIDANTGILTFAEAPDYETKSSYAATVTASDGANSSTQEISITINNINDNEPVITSSSAFSADENQTINIGFVTATDADGDTLQYGIINSIGDGTEISVNATTGEITFASAPDYETKSTYSGTVRVSDGTNVTTQDITITVNNLDDESPVFSSSDTFTADENQTAIGTVTATDIDSDSITFSISGSEIVIDSNTGVLTFVEAPDYETKSSYSSTVTATDGTNSATQDITVTINDLNDNIPEFTSSASFTADENQTAIGTVTASDADGDTLTYSVSGTELAINSNTGVLTFVEAPDYETKSSYSSTVTATDGTNSATQDITVNVNNLSDNAPVFTSESNFSVAENSTGIGTATATDADGDEIQFRVLSSDDDNISVTSDGQLNFINAPDFETKTSYSGVIEAYDSNDSTTQDITVDITNVTEESNPPAFVSFDFLDGTTVTFTERSIQVNVRVTDETGVDLSQLPTPRFDKVGGGTFLNCNEPWYLNEGTINDGVYRSTCTFPQGFPSGDYYLYTFTFYDLEGNSDDGFSNIDDNKLISVLGSEGNAPYFADFSITPSSVDVNQANATVTVTVRAVDDSDVDDTTLPTPRLTTTSGVNFSANSAWEPTGQNDGTQYRAIFTVPQGQPSGSYYVETLFFTDIFGNSAQGYSNSENRYLEVVGAEGNAPVLSDPAITPSSVNVIYEEQNVTLSITATDDSGIDVSRLPVPRLIKRFTGSTSIDASQWSLSSGTNTNGIYTAVATIPQGQPSGDYYLYTGAYFYDIYGNKADLSSTDEPYSTTLFVENVSSPVFTSDATFTANENQTAIGTVVADDPDGDRLYYTISGSEIAINTDTGVITFASAPDYETKSSYSATVTVTDKTTDVTQDITVNIINLNDNTPAITSSASFSVNENETAIGTATATDADGDTLAYSISGSEISIDSDTGVMSFVSAPDYETKTAYEATLTVFDGANSATQNVIVNINDLNDEAPVFTSSSFFSADENQTDIGFVTATDGEGDDISFRMYLPNEDDGQLIQLSTAGTLSFKEAPDYETKSEYVAKIAASDGTNENIQDIKISVNNLNDNAPAFSSNASFTADENQTVIGTVTATDADGDAVTFSISGSEIIIDSSTGAITFNEAPNYETKSSYSATVTATDGTNSATQDITVSINDLDDIAPTITSTSSFTADENQTAIGTVTATDSDSDSVTFSISGSEINIDTSTGVLTFASTPDYETKSSYSATVTATDGTNSTTQDITVAINNLNDNVPSITSSDTFAADEGQVSVGTITATDADNDDLSFSLGGNDAGSFVIGSSTGVLEFVQAYDYENDTSQREQSIIVSVTDGVNEVSQNVSVTLNNINDSSPVFTTNTEWQVAENQTTIGSISVTDADGDSITVTSSISEIDIASVDENTWTVSFASDPDYETKSLYAGTLTASDGTNSTTQDIEIAISDVDEAPVFTTPDTFTIDENTLVVGNVTATLDAGVPNEQLSFRIAFNRDSTFFDIETTAHDTGQLRFKSAPDFEQKSTYEVQVIADDTIDANNAFQVSQVITVNLNDLNDEAPVFTSASSFTVDENTTAVGTVVATDDDANTTLSYSLGGTDAASFTLDSTSGVLAFISAPDFENDPTSYSITITASDGVNSTDQNISISVNNISDSAPEITSSASFSADENQTAIGTVTATDSDGDTITFSISGAEISINANTGVLTFVAAPDYETKSSYSATVTATDGTNSATQDITVTINNLNDNTPAITSNASFTVDENETAIGTVTATDADNDTLTYSISGSEINIDSSTGVLTFASAPNYETKSSYSATVTASDGTNSVTQDITVAINDINESPTITSDASFTADENQTAIGTVTATDDEGNTITLSISGSEITINSSTGVLTFASAPDYETKSSYSATVTATDGTNSTTQDITVAINDINEKPIITSGSTYSVDENQTAIGSITATDESSDLIYELTGTDAASININNLSGVMTFASAPDYETKDTYSVIANVSDDSFTTRKAIQISINNLNDNTPAITSSSSFTADENQTAIGTVTATDADGDTITYSVSGSELSIDSSTGVLTFASVPDYETKSSYSATVTATDGTNSTTQDITVAINDLNDEAPVFTSSSSFTADENQTAIGTVTATDADANTTLAYSLGGTDAASMTINSATGVLAFASAPDYEIKSSYSVTVTATDGTNSATQNISVSVNNLNDNTPAITSSSSFTADENQTAIGTVTATDADGDTITYSVSGSELSIDSSSGVLTFSSAPNYETKSSYSATVTASDGTNSAQSALTITVNDINDVPTLEQYDCANSEAAVGTCQIGENVQDEDGDSISYSISGTDANLLSVSSSGVVSFNSWPDYESSNASADGDHVYEFLFNYTDGNSDPITQTTTWWIENANDNHATLDTTTFNINEESCTVVAEGLITSSDADGTIANQELQYGIGSGGDSNLFTLVDWDGDGLRGELNFTDCDNKANYEEGDTQYQLSIRVFDGDLGWDSGTTVTLNVQDINDRPEWTITDSRWNLTLPENQQNVSQLTNATDEDGDTLVYSIVGGDNADDFSVNSATGQISMNSAPDREALSNNKRYIQLKVTDGELSRTQELITITITDVNEAPSITSSTTYSVDENQDSAGTLTSTDLDTCATTCSGHVFSISDGDSDQFNLNSSSGELTFKTTPDYETKSSYTFSATVTDSGGLSDTETITININDVNDNLPIITSGATFTADENQFEVGTPNVQDVDVVATDADTDTLTYSMTSDTYINPENGIVTKMQIGASNGRLYFTAKPDYEAKTSYSGTVTVSDGTNSVTQDITVTINNLNDNTPFFVPGSDTYFPVYENQTAIGTVSVSDADNDTLTYSISGSEININSSTGVLTFVSAPDYETKSSYSATVTASDGTNSVSEDITVDILNERDVAPEFTSSATFSADENQTSIGTVTATDVEGDVIYYSISGSEIYINDNNPKGELTFASAPDYETKSSYTATVTASDGTNSTTQDITVNINNVNDEPTFTSSATFSADENQTSIGTVTTNDIEGDTIVYSITGSEITIDSASGVMSFVSAPDWETKSSYTATVTASDGFHAPTQAITVNVNNVEDILPSLQLCYDPDCTDGALDAANIIIEENTDLPTLYLVSYDGDNGSGTCSSSDYTGKFTFSDAYLYKDTYNVTRGGFTSWWNAWHNDKCSHGVAEFNWLSGGFGRPDFDPDYENPADENGDNVYEVKVSVSQEAEINGTNTTDLYINITITDDKTMSAVVDTYPNSAIIRSGDTSYGTEWQFHFDDTYGGNDSEVAYGTGTTAYSRYSQNLGRSLIRAGSVYAHTYNSNGSEIYPQINLDGYFDNQERGFDMAVRGSAILVGAPYTLIGNATLDWGGPVFAKRVQFNNSQEPFDRGCMLNKVNGAKPSDGFGRYVDMASTVNTIAMSDEANDSIHIVYAYDCGGGDFWDNNFYEASNIDTKTISMPGDDIGKYGFKLSSDGTSIIVQQQYESNGNQVSLVRVFSRDANDGSWSQVGSDITNFTYAGREAIDINNDGSMIAIGSADGYVHVLQKVDNAWTNYVTPFNTNNAEQNDDVSTTTRTSLSSLKMSYDTNVLAIDDGTGCLDIQAYNSSSSAYLYYGEICSLSNAESIDMIHSNKGTGDVFTHIAFRGVKNNGETTTYERFNLTHTDN